MTGNEMMSDEIIRNKLNGDKMTGVEMTREQNDWG